MRNFFLWVETICINQEDTQEKSSQVKRMNETYARADQVAVWLGLPRICDVAQSLLLDVATQKTYQVEDFDWADNMDDMAK